MCGDRRQAFERTEAEETAARKAMHVAWQNDERGAALLMALIAAALVTAIASTMVLSSSADLLITGSHRASTETMYAAEAAAQRTIGELATIADWNTVLASPPSNVLASFDDGFTTVVTEDGRGLSMAVLTSRRQAMSTVTYGPGAFGADSPVWRLFGHAPLEALLPPGVATPPVYVLTWVADDGADGDGDAMRDTNGVVLVYADAYGVSGAHRALELAVSRVTPGTIRVLSWKDPR